MHVTLLPPGHAPAAPPPGLVDPAPRASRSGRSRVSVQQELDVFAGDRSFVMSFARGVSVIQAFANVSRPMSIAEISHRIDIPRAAVRRLLHTLCELGYVEVAGLRYALTPKTLELGNAFASSSGTALGVQPIVGRLAEQLRTFCAVSVPAADDVMLMCLAGSTNPSAAPGASSGVGSKAPFYASASGQIFLGSYTDRQLDSYFSRVPMRPITFRTATCPQQVRDSARLAQTQRYAVCDRTFADDLRSIAVPVHDQRGTVVAAVVSVVKAHLVSDHDLRTTWVPALARAAHEASRKWH